MMIKDCNPCNIVAFPNDPRYYMVVKQRDGSKRIVCLIDGLLLGHADEHECKLVAENLDELYFDEDEDESDYRSIEDDPDYQAMIKANEEME